MKHIFTSALCILLLTACASPESHSNISTSPTSLQDTTASTTAPETPALEPETSNELPFEFVLYIPNEALDGFDEIEAEINILSANDVIKKLIDAGVLNENITVNTECYENENLKIDLNTAFQDQILTLGSTGERYLIGSIVNTFLSAYDAETVTITVDGETLESGHVIYDFPMEFVN